MRNASVMVAAAVVVTAVAGRVAAGQEAGASVRDGVYTEAQAARGERAFGNACGMCHEPKQFTGDAFVKAWSDRPLQVLFEIISTSMPETNPGSLPAQDNADLVAYLLSLNQYPTGAAELKGTNEAMAAIRMEPPARP